MLLTKPRYIVFLCIVLLVGCRRSGLSAEQKAELIKQGDGQMAKREYQKAVASYTSAGKGGRDGQLLMKLTQAYLHTNDDRQYYAAAIAAATALPDNVDAQLEAARAMLRGDKFADASARVEKVLEKDPKNTEALILRGNAAASLITSGYALTRFAAGRGSIVRQNATSDKDMTAEQAFRQAVALQTGPKDSSARLALVNFLWAAGRADETESILKPLADDRPDDAVSNQALGDLYAHLHRNDEAEHYLKRAAALPDGDGARRRLFNLYNTTHRREEASKVLESMLAVDDADGAVSLRLAMLDFDAGKADEALRRVEPLVTRRPPAPGSVLLKARILIAQGDWAGALPLARDAVAANSRSSAAESTLSRTLSAMGDLEGAYAAATEARTLDPKDTSALVELARLSLALGRHERAVGQAQDAVRQAPGNRDASLVLAKGLIATKDYAGADQLLQPLVARDPAPELLAQVGALHAARGNADRAREILTLALTGDSNCVDCVVGLVSLDVTHKQIGAARKRAEEAMAAHPREPHYLEAAALVYAADHDAARQEATLRKLLEVQPGNLTAALTLSRALAKQHPDQARQVIQKLLERRPQAAEAQRELVTLADR